MEPKPFVPQQSFGAQFRTMRIEAGLSLRQVAKLAGLSPTFLTDIEYNRRMPSRLHMTKLATAVGRPIGDLQQYDLREQIERLLSFLGLHPEFAPMLMKICGRIENGSLTFSDIERFVGG